MLRASIRCAEPWFAAVRVKRDGVGFRAELRIHRRGGNSFIVNVVSMAIGVLSLIACMI